MRELTQQEIQATAGGTGLIGTILSDLASLFGLGCSQPATSCGSTPSCGGGSGSNGNTSTS